MIRATAVVDLGYGDAGKGTIVDYLARTERPDYVVRFNGGPQAGHNVVLPDGRHHTFSTWGSGTFANVPTFLSRYVLVDPLAALREAEALEQLCPDMDPFEMLMVHKDCTVITPWHVLANRIREELRGDARHGSCGMGIGETMYDKQDGYELRFCELRWPSIAGMLADVRDRKARQLGRDYTITQLRTARWWDAWRRFDPIVVGRMFAQFRQRVDQYSMNVLRAPFTASGRYLFEGAQGCLIDERLGTPPYHTWSDCTFGNVDRILEGTEAELTRLGVLRTYMTRHGPGPFPTEDPDMRLPEPHNETGDWQGAVRQGKMNFPLIRATIAEIGGIDGLALTHIDRGAPGYPGKDPVELFEKQLGVPVTVRSFGPTHDEKQPAVLYGAV